MKKLLVLTSALLICGASIASAAAPGCNLTWSNCSTLATAQDYSFACDDNTLTKNLVASYRLAVATPDFVGVSATIDYVIGAPGTPDYFQFGGGGCHEGGFAPISVGTPAGCINAYGGVGVNQAGGFVNDPTGPNRWRIRADWARDVAGAQTANTLYAALVMQLNTVGAVDEGFGACAGCNVPACFVLNSLATFTQSGQGQFELLNADFRNWVTYQGGGVGGGGCPAETPSKAATWGAVKALYR